MTYTAKLRSTTGRVVACYTCPTHGEFDAEVLRDEKGEAPDEVKCEVWLTQEEAEAHGHQWFGYPTLYCGELATWTPSPSIACRVRRVEVTRGKYEKPERRTYLDTRKLGEGQDPAEFRAERRKMWRDERMNRARKEFLNK